MQSWVVENELVLHPTKTKIVDARTEGFDFLGYHFRGDLRLPREKSLRKFKDTVRRQHPAHERARPVLHCAVEIARLRGWYAYFRHCHWRTFRELDGWIRGRLRSILRKRRNRRGRARGADHQRWPNAYFDEHGLYSLNAAHVRFVQSSRG